MPAPIAFNMSAFCTSLHIEKRPLFFIFGGMCGRFYYDASNDELTSAYPAEIGEEYSARKPKKDLRITDEAWVMTADEPGKLQLMHFGLVPWYAKECRMQGSTFNARKDTLLTSTLWKKLMEDDKRCIIITSGFTEPQKVSSKQTLHWKFTVNDRPLFSMAGLWSEWRERVSGSVYRSFAIITNDANAKVGEVHDKQRMPCILTRDEEQLWLSKDLEMQQYLDLLRTYPDQDITRESTFKPGEHDAPKGPAPDLFS
jgi:putative SOS response-associated peptidase YedK